MGTLIFFVVNMSVPFIGFIRGHLWLKFSRFIFIAARDF
jgi:hypothetical protein